MAKFYGLIGYTDTIETDPVNRPGVFREVVLDERHYYGDVLSNNKRFEKGEHLNDDLNVRNEISILADQFAFENFAKLRYLYWNGTKWKITDVKLAYPRMVLTIGGIYNGQTD